LPAVEPALLKPPPPGLTDSGRLHRGARGITRRAAVTSGKLADLLQEILMARMIVVDRDGKEHAIEAKPGLKIMEILRELDYGVAAICGGLCSCATCHVYVD